jgi:hypothetical protein
MRRRVRGGDRDSVGEVDLKCHRLRCSSECSESWIRLVFSDTESALPQSGEMVRGRDAYEIGRCTLKDSL